MSRTAPGYRRLTDAVEFHAAKKCHPNEGTWAAGVRLVVCEIRGTQGKLTGSVRLSGDQRPRR